MKNKTKRNVYIFGYNKPTMSMSSWWKCLTFGCDNDQYETYDFCEKCIKMLKMCDNDRYLEQYGDKICVHCGFVINKYIGICDSCADKIIKVRTETILPRYDRHKFTGKRIKNLYKHKLLYE